MCWECSYFYEHQGQTELVYMYFVSKTPTQKILAGVKITGTYNLFFFLIIY